MLDGFYLKRLYGVILKVTIMFWASLHSKWHSRPNFDYSFQRFQTQCYRAVPLLASACWPSFGPFCQLQKSCFQNVLFKTLEFFYPFFENTYCTPILYFYDCSNGQSRGETYCSFNLNCFKQCLFCLLFFEAEFGLSSLNTVPCSKLTCQS